MGAGRLSPLPGLLLRPKFQEVLRKHRACAPGDGWGPGPPSPGTPGKTATGQGVGTTPVPGDHRVLTQRALLGAVSSASRCWALPSPSARLPWGPPICWLLVLCPRRPCPHPSSTLWAPPGLFPHDRCSGARCPGVASRWVSVKGRVSVMGQSFPTGHVGAGPGRPGGLGRHTAPCTLTWLPITSPPAVPCPELLPKSAPSQHLLLWVSASGWPP